MRHAFISCSVTKAAAALLMALLLGTGLLVARPAAAQSLADDPAAHLAYGSARDGSVTSQAGTEHFFTGCSDETVGISVLADGFDPRLELYAPGNADKAIASGGGATGFIGVGIDGIDLPTNGTYTIVVSGRTRADRGDYQVVLRGDGPDNPLEDDGPNPITLLYGGTIDGELDGNNYTEWSFRGCAGDEIKAVAVGDGFSPILYTFHEIAEAAIATATPEPGGDPNTATLTRVLPRNGVYNLGISAADIAEIGEFTLEFTLEGNSPPDDVPVGETPTVISEFTPTPTQTPTQVPNATPTPTPRAGVRRGTPTPRGGTPVQATPTPTATNEPIERPTPTNTPEFEMPGMGEGAFTVIDVSSNSATSSSSGVEYWGPINHAAYSNDGDVIVTAGEDGVIRAWDSFRGRLLQEMEGHEDRVNFVAFSPDDSLVASASDDGTVRLWDEEGNETALLEMPLNVDTTTSTGVNNGVNSVAFSPDGTQLVATTDLGVVVVWDVENEAIALELEGNQGPVYTAVYSPDGTQIATGDGIGVVRLFDAETGELIDSLPVNAGPGSGDPILSLAFVNDGEAIVVGGVVGVNSDSVQVWELASGEPIGALPSHGEWGAVAVVRPEETHLLVEERAEPSHDGPVAATARLYTVETGELAIAFVGFQNGVVAAAFAPDNDELMLSDGNYLYLWPAPMIDVFGAAYGEPIGVQLPVPTSTPARATATPTSASDDTPTPTPEAEATPTPFLPTELQIYCTVTTDRLNLRPGPGTNYNPPITVLELGDLLIAVGRNADSSWLQVTFVEDNLSLGETGWVSANFLFCVGPDIEDLPVVEVE